MSSLLAKNREGLMPAKAVLVRTWESKYHTSLEDEAYILNGVPEKCSCMAGFHVSTAAVKINWTCQG